PDRTPSAPFSLPHYLHHRHLHSFPTRRSSDLVAGIVRAMLGKKASHHNVLVTRADAKVFAAVKKANGKAARAAKFHPLSGVITIDRKSTRLNSSHRTISYAVFCLKKKTQQQQH